MHGSCHDDVSDARKQVPASCNVAAEDTLLLLLLLQTIILMTDPNDKSSNGWTLQVFDFVCQVYRCRGIIVKL